MKNIILLFLAALSLLAARPAQAWTYNNGDVLLVFRNGSQDVEFDLGSVTNFLGRTNGYATTVPGWNASLVTSTFGTLNDNVDVVLLATSGTTNWLSSAEPNTTAYNISSQAAETLNAVINGVGTRPLYPINIPTSGTNSYSIDTGGQYASSSYDSIVSDGHFNGIPQLGGNVPFQVQQGIPGLLDFWTISPTTIYPNSPPDTLVGTFYITTNAVLTFVAGPRSSTITGESVAGNLSTIQFTTTIGNTYAVVYTNKLAGAVASWPVDPNSLVGDGRVDTIVHTNNGSAQFYRISTH